MNDTQKKIIDDYVSNVKERFVEIRDFIFFLPNSTPHFWGDNTIERLPDADRKKLEEYLLEARSNREKIAVCEENIVKRMDACIDHVERVKENTETPSEATPLFIMVYGLFDETLRFSALAMQSVTLSEKIARLLEKYDEEKAAAARQSLAAKIDEISAGLSSLREIVEDQHRHAWERWATVPECVRAIVDMAKTEKADGKNISLPGNENTLRIKISNWLNEHGKRREGTQKKPYFQTADIADAAGVFYKEFEPVQYLREFEKIGIPAERIPKPKKK